MLTNILVVAVVVDGGRWCTVMEAELACKEDQHGTADWVASVPSWSSSQPDRQSYVSSALILLTIFIEKYRPAREHPPARSLSFVMSQCSPSVHQFCWRERRDVGEKIN